MGSCILGDFPVSISQVTTVARIHPSLDSSMKGLFRGIKPKVQSPLTTYAQGKTMERNIISKVLITLTSVDYGG